ncbi:MAG: hypothetical protein JO252_00845 [Planctomycetaceae bacterium]|nr:hypothetical protein [Planctomycetaceae bacterium]
MGRLDGRVAIVTGSDETVRKALWATLPDCAVRQRQLQAALAGHLPRALRKHPQRLAIDLTLIPDHGQPCRDLNAISRGQAKDGTSHFHAYATAAIIRKGQRYTVALTGVCKGEPVGLRRFLGAAGFLETVATLPGSLGLCSCSHSPEMSRKSILGRTRGHHKRSRSYNLVNAGKMSQIIPVAKLQSRSRVWPSMDRLSSEQDFNPSSKLYH